MILLFFLSKITIDFVLLQMKHVKVSMIENVAFHMDITFAMKIAMYRFLI